MLAFLSPIDHVAWQVVYDWEGRLFRDMRVDISSKI